MQSLSAFSPAWPNGTYLGQMHPYHSDFYRGYAERRGWDPCTTWATDQRNSAIRGLRELGYTVIAPEEDASPTQTPAADSEEVANLWVRLFNADRGRLEAQVLQFGATIDPYDLDVSLFAGANDLGTLCNSETIFADEWSTNLGCSRENVLHTAVTRVNVSIGSILAQLHLKCNKSSQSTADVSVFACYPR